MSAVLFTRILGVAFLNLSVLGVATGSGSGGMTVVALNGLGFLLLAGQQRTAEVVGRCDAYTLGPVGILDCTLPDGHRGQHHGTDGAHWSGRVR